MRFYVAHGYGQWPILSEQNEESDQFTSASDWDPDVMGTVMGTLMLGGIVMATLM